MHYLAKFLVYLLFLCLATSGYLAFAQGPYHGRVIDAETKDPIEGAVVLAIWRELTPGVAQHPKATYHDVRETFTDRGGNFTIPGILGIPSEATAKIDEPLFTIFKPGHEAYGGGNLKPPSTPKPIREKYKLPEQVYEKDGRMVVELKRLTTKEERLRNLVRLTTFSYCFPTQEAAERRKSPQLSPGSAKCIPEEKFPNLIRLKNIEERALGLQPSHVWKGENQ